MAPAEPDPLPGGELAAFAAAVEAGSIHGAADALSLTASAVTKRVQSLERRLGVELFDRGRHGVRPTEAARLLYPEARGALAALAAAREAVAPARASARSVLRLASSHTVGEFLLPSWLAAYRRAAPDVRAEVDVVGSAGVVEAVRDRAADVGFVEGRDDLAGLEAIEVARDELVVVVAADHRWARRRSVRARQLEGESFVSREARSGTRAVADLALAQAGVSLEPSLQVASIQGVKRALAAGGFAVMSRLAVDAEVRAGALRALEVADADLGRSLRAVRLPGAGAAAARAFWAWLEAEAGPSPRS